MQAQLPINLVFNFINDPTLRKVYSLLAGFILQWFMFRDGNFKFLIKSFIEIIHTLLMTTVSYVLMLSLPRLTQHRVVCVYAFLYLSFIHIKRMYYGKIILSIFNVFTRLWRLDN
jgi:hypothetical protein